MNIQTKILEIDEKENTEKQIYLYHLSEGAYDLYDEIILSHEKKFTEKEFENMCKEAFKKVKAIKKVKYIWVGDLAELLIEEYGFKEFEHHYQAKYYFPERSF